MLWPSMGENLSLPATLAPARRQVNAQALLREVQAEEEGVKIGT